MHVLNESYVPECISWKRLLNPMEKGYQAKGAPLDAADTMQLGKDNEKTQSSSLLTSENVSRNHKATPPRVERHASVCSEEPPIQKPQAEEESAKVYDELQGESLEYADELADVIKKTKIDYGDLVGRISHSRKDYVDLSKALDDSDEEQSASTANQTVESDHDEDSEAEDRPRKLPKKSKHGNFSCMKKHDGSSNENNPNDRTIETLTKMADYYDRIRDQWRTVAYRRVISVLKRQPRKITTKEEAYQLKFVGIRLSEKIEEIVLTNRLRRLDNALDDPTDQILQKFMGIYGVGVVQASRWVNSGYKTISDLLDKAKLSDNQRIGISHYDDFASRVPRAEVKRHGEVVSEALRKIDPGFQVEVMGSYRRGANDSGDIDLMITKPDTKIEIIRQIILDSLVPRLTDQGFLKACLATTHRDTGTKWHGCSALPGSTIWRRIDLLLVPWDEMGAALIYFTGNDLFNRSIRLLASKKGMRLNQRGLYKNVMRGPNRIKMTEGELVEGRSERRIFEILGVPWRPPHHRVC